MKLNSLLSILADQEVHSGESLARELGVSRTAIWKQVRKAMSEGYAIETIRGQGYRLSGRVDLLDRQVILRQLEGNLASQIELEILGETDSTNAEVARRLARGQSRIPVILADCQTAGRGRRGRNWSSPKGQNLYLSLGLPIKGDFTSLDGLSLVLGVAAAEALESIGKASIKLKWPNDLFAEGRKCSGILVEIQGELQQGYVQVIAGIGINVHMQQADEVDQPWTSLDLAWPEITWIRNSLAAAIIEAILKSVSTFEKEGFEPFREHWQARDLFKGKTVAAREGQLKGVGSGVDSQGNYLLEVDGSQVAVRAGDISLRVKP